jgi:hypothetical protein
MITQEKLKEMFDYKDGHLYWKAKKRKVTVGNIAGSLNRKYGNKTDYWSICVNKTRYKAHRLIWIYHFGYEPPMIDHIDGDGLNNRIENLRLTTPSQNCFNRKCRALSGVKGVYFTNKTKKWRAEFVAYGKKIYLGTFADKQDAIHAIHGARMQAHGEFASF